MLVCLPVFKRTETRPTWYLKDEVMRRGRIYYAKLAGGRSMFVAPRLISHFAAGISGKPGNCYTGEAVFEHPVNRKNIQGQGNERDFGNRTRGDHQLVSQEYVLDCLDFLLSRLSLLWCSSLSMFA